MIQEWTREIAPRGEGAIITFLSGGEARGAIMVENREERELWMRMTDNLQALSAQKDGKN